MRYSAAEVKVAESLTAAITLHNRRREAADMAMVDLGAIPGLSLDPASLEALVASNNIERYDREGNRYRLYLRRIAGGAKTKLAVRYVATQPAVAKAPSIRAYHYYEPEVSADALPVQITVRQAN